MNAQRIIGIIILSLVFLKFCVPNLNSIEFKLSRGEEIFIPTFSLPNLYEGRSNLSSEDFLGEYSILTYFASWCGSCRLKHPQIVRLSKETRLKFYAIALQDKEHKLKEFLENSGDPFLKIGMDNSGLLANQFNIFGVPTVLLINRQGKIIHSLKSLNVADIKELIYEDYISTSKAVGGNE